MNQAYLHFKMALATIVMFLLALWINAALFPRLEFVPGINWVYLPAGVRLLSTLLFGEAGAVGLLLVSWLVGFLYFFPNDPVRAFVGGILATAAPYGAYKLAQSTLGLRTSLSNLTPQKLLICAFVYALANPLLHHIWFYLHGQRDGLASGFFIMFVGDLSGTLIILYSAKGTALLAQNLVSRRSSSVRL